MEKQKSQLQNYADRRQRLHELLIALIQHQEKLELLDADDPSFDWKSSHSQEKDPARWLDRNKRILKRYQSLVRSAITLETLLEAEQKSFD